jgi:hypothetical protein
MPPQTDTRLSEQLRQAKEMGYSDGEIWAVLEMANKNSGVGSLLKELNLIF